MKCFFAKDEADVAGWICATRGGHCDEIVPIMPRAALALQVAGAGSHRLPVEYLDRDVRNGVLTQSVAMSRDWYRQEFGALNYRGVDLLDCCRLQMLAFCQDYIVSSRFADAIIEEGKIREAVFSRRPRIPSVGRAMHDGTADVFEGTLFWRLEKAGISVSIDEQSPAKTNSARRGLNGFLGRIRRLVGKVRSRMAPGGSRVKTDNGDVGRGDPMRVRLHDLIVGKSLVVGYGAGYDLLVIWPYIRAIADRCGAEALLVSGEASLDTRTVRSALKLDPNLRFVFDGDIKPNDVDDEVRGVQAQLRSLKGRVAELPAPFSVPSLRFQIDVLLDNLVPQALNASRVAFEFFQRADVKLYLDDWCGGTATRAWAATGNQLGIATVNVAHGATNLVEFHDFNARWGFAWGELNRDNIAMGAEGKEDRIIVVGDPSLEALRRTVGDVVRKPQVLLLTGGCLQQVWTDVSITQLFTTWREIVQIVTEFQDLRFIIKPHPSYRDFGKWYRELIGDASAKNLEVREDCRVEEIAPGSVLAVLVGRPGTAGVVTMLNGVPTVFLDTMLVRDPAGFRIWRDEMGVPTLKSGGDLAALLSDILKNPAASQEVLRANRRFVAKYLGPLNVDTAVRHMFGWERLKGLGD